MGRPRKTISDEDMAAVADAIVKRKRLREELAALPSERAMAAQLGVSRGTIRQMIAGRTYKRA